MNKTYSFSRKFFFLAMISCISIFFTQPAYAAELAIDGATLSVFWAIPFACMLLSIALLPIIVPTIWEHHFGKISFFWACAFLVPCILLLGFDITLYNFLHAILLEYIPFIALLLSLFTVAGGIRLKGSLVGKPIVNLGLFAIGTLLASWIGTTGAAMLFLRPLLQANKHRKYRVHTVIFFIFLVANIGGSLTPLGDPPLFLGFLKGVPFFWPLTHLFPLMLFLACALLVLYFLLDTFLYNKEVRTGLTIPKVSDTDENFGIEGCVNFIFLFVILGAVLISGTWNYPGGIEIYGTRLTIPSIFRDCTLLLTAALSLLVTNKEIRKRNEFSWHPMTEVAKLFFGIFISMIPAIAILNAGEDGALATCVRLVNEGGVPNNAVYFWVTGALSSFLDNAPTYLVFFNTATSSIPAEALSSGISSVEILYTDMSMTLLAISAGSVFMGAMTYIGNAPNFMVRSIAENSGVKMPGFLGYMLWSCAILLPLFIVLTYLFF